MRLTIDGRNVEAAEGMSILQAAKTVGIEIPTLCYLEGISDIGSCRLCVVEVEGKNELATACNTKAKEGMVVQTASERVIEARKTVLKLLLSNHNIDCFNCEKMVTANFRNIVIYMELIQHRISVPEDC
mgnify:FL=1